ncbi:uncharacterized protein C8A04DRAFT_26316 [Dichotomopilus funicola]|uniref:Aminoglycoside phosphotransferase domain-containing protein n=1 Tax=Dichotomopilus funicola TaxID=1934379 RepID=A0AAN6ZPA1_9PEZI|nr:hypothetical protein C8A04DRAFT_26316 [Dichotomopilus funicola]
MAPPLFLHEYKEPGVWAVHADRKIYHLPNLFQRCPSATRPTRPSSATCAMYLAMEFVSGAVPMDELSEAERKVVEKELRVHMETLKSLRSGTPGVPGEEFLVGPVRVCGYRWHYHTCWRPRPGAFPAPKSGEDGKEGGGGQFVLCHNDLAQQNVLVDPKTLKIKAIIDWEFAGFWPPWFERP